MTRVLIIGVTGQVGGALAETMTGAEIIGTRLSDDSSAWIRFSLEEAAKDPTHAEKLLEQTRPNIVYITAGFTRVDACEEEPARAHAINCDGPTAVCRAARTLGAKTVYYSTEYVFDGVRGPYTEEDQPNPLSVYGKSKLAGEDAILGEGPDALILRTTVVFGPEIHGKNFAYQLAARLAAKETMRVPQDQVSSPTYNRDLATASVALVESGAHGVFNVVGPETMDRAVFAKRLARAVHLDETLIGTVSTKTLKQIAPRPLNAGLEIDKMRSAVPQVKMRTVEEAVAHWQTHPRGKSWPT